MAHPDPKWSMNVKIGRMDSEDKSGFGVGQFVNDSCKPEIDSSMDFADCSEELRKYQVRKSSPGLTKQFIVGRSYRFKCLASILTKLMNNSLSIVLNH